MLMRSYRNLAYASPDDVIFGWATHPVRSGFEVAIGEGQVIPEVDFTLPVMPINSDTWPEVQRQYQKITTGVLARAHRLNCDVLGLEIEHLYEMTTNPEWGAELTRQVKSVMKDVHEKLGIRSTLRVTVADIRQKEKPAIMRTGKSWQDVIDSFEACAAAGADILSIESTGGKEIFDEAVVRGDIPAILYSLGVLACRDVRFLWRDITKIAEKYQILPGGDSACGFGNTAMQLAHQNYIPRVLAAMVRAASAVRTLCAYEEGARGPGKDCAYENPVIKIITGVPIAMEGRSAACAHSSPLGNISAAVCDFWANESVQNIQLLGGPAPEVFSELLIYDCRLMNTAHRLGQAKLLRKLFVESDRNKDPQALFLDPEICYSLAERIVSESDDYARTLEAARFACSAMKDAVDMNLLRLGTGELKWLKEMEKVISSLPDTEDSLWTKIQPKYARLVLPEEYGLN